MNNPLSPFLIGIGVVIIIIGLILGVSIGQATAGPFQSFSWVFAFLIWIGHFAAGMIFIALAEIINQIYEFRHSFLSFDSLFSKTTKDPNAKANELYVKSVTVANKMKSDSKTYSDAARFYNTVSGSIDNILSKYTSSSVAVSLVAEDRNISGYTLTNFRGLESTLKDLANAEKEPLLCALIVANTIDDSYYKANALGQIAGKYTELGEDEKSNQLLMSAMHTAKLIKDKSLKMEILAQIAEEYAEAGESDKAYQIANAIDDQRFKDQVLSAISRMHVESGDLSKSMEIINTIKDSYYKIVALNAIAYKFKTLGEHDKGDDILSKNIDKSISLHDKYLKLKALSDISYNYSKLSQLDKSSEMLSQMLPVIDTIDDNVIKATALNQIAGNYSKLGEDEKSFQLLSEAIENAKSLDDGLLKSKTISEIAVNYIRLGKNETGIQLLSNTVETIAKIDDKSTQKFALSIIAIKYMSRRESDKPDEVSLLSRAHFLHMETPAAELSFIVQKVFPLEAFWK